MSKNTEKYNNQHSRKENAMKEMHVERKKSDKQLIKACIEKYTLKTPVFEQIDLDSYINDMDRIKSNSALMNKMSIPASLRVLKESLDEYDAKKDIKPSVLKMLDKLVDSGMLSGYGVYDGMDTSDFNRLVMSDVDFKKIYNGTILNVFAEDEDVTHNTYQVAVDLDHLKGVKLIMTRNNLMRNTDIGDNEYCPGDKISVSFFRSSVGKVYPSEKAASRLKQYNYKFEVDQILDGVTIIKTGKLNCVQLHDYNDIRCMLENGSSFKYETGDMLNIKITSVKSDDTGVVLSGVSVK